MRFALLLVVLALGASAGCVAGGTDSDLALDPSPVGGKADEGSEPWATFPEHDVDEHDKGHALAMEFARSLPVNEPVETQFSDVEGEFRRNEFQEQGSAIPTDGSVCKLTLEHKDTRLGTHLNMKVRLWTPGDAEGAWGDWLEVDLREIMFSRYRRSDNEDSGRITLGDVTTEDGDRQLWITRTERDDYSSWRKETLQLRVTLDERGAPTALEALVLRSRSSFEASSREIFMSHLPGARATVLWDVSCSL